MFCTPFPYTPLFRSTIVPLNQVESVGHVDYSVMPAGLINPLGEEELRDLVAYILSSGNADHAFFKTEEELEEERKREEAEREKEVKRRYRKIFNNDEFAIFRRPVS